MSAVSRPAPLLAILALLAATSLALTLAAPGAQAATYKKCSLSERDQDPPGAKPTYNLTLKRIGTTCTTAKKVMNAFHACRSRKAVNCSRTLLSRWRCSARRDSTANGIFYATFTCKYGTRRVRSSYQQNT